MSRSDEPYLLPSTIEFNDLIDELDEPFIRKERLRFIDARLFWTGRLRRDDICQQFEIHETNASKDISVYRSLKPNNVHYDRNEKIYKATPKFQPIGRQQSIQSLLSYSMLNMRWLGSVPDYLVTTPLPNRQPSLSVIRNFTVCAEQNCGIEIFYRSMKNPNGENRIVYPQYIIFDGLRWHVRAYCTNAGNYRDFVLSRVDIINNLAESITLPEDALWNKQVELVVVPHSNLSKAQKDLVSMDFNMTNGEMRIQTRQPLAYYIIRNLYLDSGLQPPRQLIECANWKEFV
mgnify:CR=1 FL=1